ncbi:hypothetical protein ACFWY9_43160 [Amycolatopsis sp. NPDC059027]|uniref:hypothetical protein n=1 Tax=unclassified Amycolatopsis TaxID=2618356 RepID=UPI00366D27E6
MSYPQYPGQQPNQGQPGVPPQYPPSGGYPVPGQQPAYGQPYPGGYPQGPGFVPPHQKPSGVTAIFAGVLAVLGGVYYLVSAVVQIIALFAVSHRYASWIVFITTFLYLVLAGLLLAGGILLFLKKPAGRMLGIVGSALAIAVVLLGFVLSLVGLSAFRHFSGSMVAGAGIVALVFVVIPATATLVLSLVRPTAVWVGKAQPAGVYPPGGGYPQQYPR